MSWISEHKKTICVVELVLLLVAILGPWVYSADGVPPAEWCREPNILLDNERCVKLMSGAELFAFMAFVFISMSVGLVSGVVDLTGRGREFLGTLLSLVVLLPLVTTLLLILRRDSRRLQIFHLAALVLAAVYVLLTVPNSMLQLARLWGLWLYFGVVVSALILETLLLISASRPSKES